MFESDVATVAGGNDVTISPDPRIGSELVGYRFDALLGRGGMGVVYRAFDPRLKRNVALKLLAPDLAEDARFRERFLRESELAASIDHASIVPVYEAGEADGQLYIAMRYVEGTDLETLLREWGALELERGLALCSQLADALDTAHERGLVHRDVKPSNVLVDERGHCYLADFGLTRRVTEHDDLSGGRTVGAVDYVAPEQICGEEVSASADVYSLGCLFFECLTGEPPFPRASELAVLFAHVEEEPPNASERRRELPQAIDAVLCRALAKNPNDRYATCRELIDTARHALRTSRKSRRRLVFVALALIAGSLGVVLPLTLTGGSSGVLTTPRLAIETDSVQRIDVRTNGIVGTTRVGTGPGLVAAGAGAIWVANFDDRTLSRLDPSTGVELKTIAAGGTPTGLAVGEGAVWVTHGFEGTISRIDPGLDRIAATIAVGSGVKDVAVGAGSVWAVNGLEGSVLRIDPATNTVAARIEVGGRPTGIAAGAGAVWVGSGSAVLRIDPGGNAVRRRIALGSSAARITAGENAVWVSSSHADSVIRIDVETSSSGRAIPVGDHPTGIAAGQGAIWVAESLDGTVARIDPATRAVVARVKVGKRSSGVALSGGAVWVSAPVS